VPGHPLQRFGMNTSEELRRLLVIEQRLKRTQRISDPNSNYSSAGHSLKCLRMNLREIGYFIAIELGLEFEPQDPRFRHSVSVEHGTCPTPIHLLSNFFTLSFSSRKPEQGLTQSGPACDSWIARSRTLVDHRVVHRGATGAPPGLHLPPPKSVPGCKRAKGGYLSGKQVFERKTSVLMRLWCWPATTGTRLGWVGRLWPFKSHSDSGAYRGIQKTAHDNMGKTLSGSRLTADKASFQRPTDKYLSLWPAQCAGSVQLSEDLGGTLYGSNGSQKPV